MRVRRVRLYPCGGVHSVTRVVTSEGRPVTLLALPASNQPSSVLTQYSASNSTTEPSLVSTLSVKGCAATSPPITLSTEPQDVAK